MPPRILPRAEHNVSRKDIDADALNVMYRLKSHGFLAYMVGGGVRDLLLGRRPKDIDIGTNAHPQQVKKLFRNCFVIGRRFRLCHVRFGRKVIEVSTFRRQAPAEEGDTLIRRDNTFGTPGGGRLPPRLHRERAVLRHRDLLGDRLRGRAARTWSAASSGPSAIPWSACARTRCACCARWRWPRASASASTATPSRRSAPCAARS